MRNGNGIVNEIMEEMTTNTEEYKQYQKYIYGQAKTNVREDRSYDEVRDHDIDDEMLDR